MSAVEEALSKVEDYSIKVSIDISFSYETQRWDAQLTSETLIKIGAKEKRLRRDSSCIDLNKIAMRGLDIENEVSSELTILWHGIRYKIEKYLESQNIVMDMDSFTEYMEGKTNQ